MTFTDNRRSSATEQAGILLVTDEGEHVDPLAETLLAGGFRVVTTTVGAVLQGKRSEIPTDLVILEVPLARTSIFQLCRALKQGNQGESAPVLCLVGESESDTGWEQLSAAGIDLLTKPVRPRDVLARVRLHLGYQQKIEKLNAAEKAKDLMLCIAAHDLRNPLVSIRALTNVLRSESVGPVTVAQRDLLDTAYDASQSMLNLVNELLEVSVLEGGKLNLVPSPISPTLLVTAAVKLCNATAAQKGSFIAWDPNTQTPDLALDKPRIRQVLNNLLDNAVKFSPPGSMITVRSEFTSGQFAIVVQDQGPGIPEHERSLLFKIFSRTSVRPTGEESSTGVGLFVCQKIMQAHRGSISTANLPGGGAEFRLLFPLPT
jgi:signal transduction histidine kinase